MQAPPLSSDETNRLETLRRYALDDVRGDGALQDLAAFAARTCDAPVSMISFVDDARQRLVARHGVEFEEVPRDIAICTHTLAVSDVLEVPDLRADPRFAENPLVTGPAAFRFYAGAPLRDPGGSVLGTIAVADRTPRSLTENQRDALRALSRHVMAYLGSRRRAGELVRGERQLRAILETEPEGVIVLAEDGSVLEMNPAGLRLLEAESLEEARRMRLEPLVDQPHREAFAGLIGRVFAGGSGTLTFRVIGLKGTMRWLETHVAPMRDESGAIAALVGVIRDVSDRTRIEDEPSEHTSQDVTERRRTQRHILHLNRVHAVLSGVGAVLVRQRDPAQILSTACRIAVTAGGFAMAWIGMADENGRLRVRAHAGADTAALAVIEDLIHQDPPGGCRFTARSFTAGIRAVSGDLATDPAAALWRHEALARGYRSMASFPLKEQDRVVGTFNIYAGEPDAFDDEELSLLDQLASDISFALEMHAREREHQQAEAARRRVEERFREVVETIREAFWITSPSSDEVFYVSPAYETIWGRPCADLYASPYDWFEAIHAEDRERIRHALRTRQHSGDFDETYRIVRPDGTIRWIRDRAFPIRNDAGEVIRIVGTAMDITDQRHLEEQFRQAQKMESIGRLAGGIAHDFNNLLTVINGIADLVIANLRRQDPLRADLELIRQSGARAALLTRQLLASSRQQLLQPEIINLSTVIGGMGSMLRRLIGEEVELVFVLPKMLGQVRADPGQIQQVIMNLAVNARDAMPDGGTLTIEARDVEHEVSSAEHAATQSEPQVMVTVTDTGVGMDEHTRERVFEPFFTTKEVGRGTGLGLSTVYGIVEQSGGSIRVDSEAGRGTTFTIWLPRVDDTSEREQVSSGAPLVHGGETILLVEDERALRALAVRVLTSAGYTVLDAADGDEALRVLERHGGPVHLTITDVVMPGMTGRELAERLRLQRPEMKILYTSGYTDDAILRHGVLDDPRFFIGKPYAPADLRRRVRDLLDHG